MFNSVQLISLFAALAATVSAGPIVRRSTCLPVPCSTDNGNICGNHAREPTSFAAAKQIAVKGGQEKGFNVLTSTGISCVPSVTINGNMGVAPVALSYITAFDLTLYSDHATSPYVVGGGKIYAADTAESQTPLAVGYMKDSYKNAAQMTADYSECQAGTLDNLVLVPGVYSWTTALALSGDASVTLKGTNNPNEYFILQAAGPISFGANSKVFLDGVTTDQVFWVGAVDLTVGDHAQFQGVALTYTNIVIADNALVKGRLWTQTEVSFAKNSVVMAPSSPLLDMPSL